MELRLRLMLKVAMVLAGKHRLVKHGRYHQDNMAF